MQRLPLGPLYYEFSRHNEPRLRIQPGDSLIVESEDAFSGQIRTDSDRRDKTKKPYGNPQTGPIYIEGAEPGDSLAITIHEIKPTLGQCATRTSDPKQLAEWLGTECPHGTHVCPIRDGKIYWSDQLTIPYQPMLGCIGTAPDTGVPTTFPAGPHGGNMDIIEVAPGNIIYLPVYVPGGYLYLGDAHAAMGHGELSASGLEMPAETTITVNLQKGKKIPGPRIESPTEIMTVVSGCPLERSDRRSFRPPHPLARSRLRLGPLARLRPPHPRRPPQHRLLRPRHRRRQTGQRISLASVGWPIPPFFSPASFCLSLQNSPFALFALSAVFAFNAKTVAHQQPPESLSGHPTKLHLPAK